MRTQKQRIRNLALLAPAILLACSTAPKEPISLTADWYEAGGEAIISDEKPRSWSRDRAIRIAEQSARAKIKEHFREVSLPNGQTILEAMTHDKYCWSKIMGVLAATKSHEQIDREDGSVAVLLRIDMDFVRRVCIRGKEAGVLGPRESK